MKHLTTTLCAMYFAASVALLRCAVISQQNGSPGYCALFAGCAVLLALGIVHHAYHRDELRAALVRLDRATRPRDATPAVDGVVAVALAAACCETWWTSAGADHEPTCPNHQHRSAA